MEESCVMGNMCLIVGECDFVLRVKDHVLLMGGFWKEQVGRFVVVGNVCVF